MLNTKRDEKKKKGEAAEDKFHPFPNVLVTTL